MKWSGMQKLKSCQRWHFNKGAASLENIHLYRLHLMPISCIFYQMVTNGNQTVIMQHKQAYSTKLLTKLPTNKLHTLCGVIIIHPLIKRLYNINQWFGGSLTFDKWFHKVFTIHLITFFIQYRTTYNETILLLAILYVSISY